MCRRSPPLSFVIACDKAAHAFELQQLQWGTVGLCQCEAFPSWGYTDLLYKLTVRVRQWAPSSHLFLRFDGSRLFGNLAAPLVAYIQWGELYVVLRQVAFLPPCLYGGLLSTLWSISVRGPVSRPFVASGFF